MSAAGLWLDAQPIPDIFAALPFEIPGLLFADPVQGATLLTGGLDLNDMDALKDFYIGNARRLAMAGKILFPIPNRRLSKRLYRLTAPTLVLWGAKDRLIPPAYAARWGELLPHATIEIFPEAGHMLPYERPEAVATAFNRFLV